MSLVTDPLPLWPAGAVPGALGTGPADVPTLTPYLLEGPGARAAVIVCPGGGYAGLAPHEGEPVARWLNSLGISALVLRYRVAPYRHPNPLRDAQRALRTVRHHSAPWGVDPARLGILGFSAGGHLAATAGVWYDAGQEQAQDPIERQGCRPDALILCYAVLSFGPGGHRGSAANLLGPEPADGAGAAARDAAGLRDADRRQLLSTPGQVTADTPQAFLWHTADDAAVPVADSLAFATALGAHGVPYALHVYPHGRHGLGLAEGDGQVGSWTDQCQRWLAGLGWTQAG